MILDIVLIVQLIFLVVFLDNFHPRFHDCRRLILKIEVQRPCLLFTKGFVLLASFEDGAQAPAYFLCLQSATPGNDTVGRTNKERKI